MKYLSRNKKIVLILIVIIFILVGAIVVSKSNNQKERKEAIIYFNKSQEYEKALVLAKEYVALYPEDVEGWTHRGYAYFGLGNCAEAISDLTHASMNGSEEGDKLLTSVLNSDVCRGFGQ